VYVAPINTPTITGVFQKRLNALIDGRGDVTEIWSLPWKNFIRPAHVYRSVTDYGVVKAFHYHNIHTDQMAITDGKLQIVLVDLREGSTYGHLNQFFVGKDARTLLRVPPGILHGWKALSSPYVEVHNLQDMIHDPNDEIRYPWDCLPVSIWQPINA
jgi:dTDP-4-dehydrorhamnose 3,5-epimerase